MAFEVKVDLLPTLWDLLSLPALGDADKIVFFGVRAALPTHGTDKRVSVKLDGAKSFDHLVYRCTLMQWYREGSDRMAAFTASTVPNGNVVRGGVSDNGQGVNLLAPGCYPFIKGPHPRSGDPVTRKAFREPDGKKKLVLRTGDDRVYEWTTDRIEVGNVFDNIHAGGAGNSFSSAGCQVLQGGYTTPGDWRVFRDRAYAINQSEFRYLMLPASVWKAILVDPSAPRIVVGSKGERAKAVQKRLIAKGLLTGTADGDFGPNSGAALLRFQRQSSNPLAADAICGLDTARELGIADW